MPRIAISPFVLVFSVSVFSLVHSWMPKWGPEKSTPRVVADFALPKDFQKLAGRPLVDALKRAWEKAQVPGEIGFVRHLIKEQKLIIPVSVPGCVTTMTVNLSNREATMVVRESGLEAR